MLFGIVLILLFEDMVTKMSEGALLIVDYCIAWPRLSILPVLIYMYSDSYGDPLQQWISRTPFRPPARLSQ